MNSKGVITAEYQRFDPLAIVENRLSPLTVRHSVRFLFGISIETIGEALSHGWRVTVRCAGGPRDGMKRVRNVSMAES